MHNRSVRGVSWRPPDAVACRPMPTPKVLVARGFPSGWWVLVLSGNARYLTRKSLADYVPGYVSRAHLPLAPAQEVVLAQPGDGRLSPIRGDVGLVQGLPVAPSEESSRPTRKVPVPERAPAATSRGRSHRRPRRPWPPPAADLTRPRCASPAQCGRDPRRRRRTRRAARVASMVLRSTVSARSSGSRSGPAGSEGARQRVHGRPAGYEVLASGDLNSARSGSGWSQLVPLSTAE